MRRLPLPEAMPLLSLKGIVWLGGALMNKPEPIQAKKAEQRRPIMELMRWRTTLAVLWIIQAVNFAAVVFYGFYEQSGESKVGITLFLLIPCLLAWLSVTLKASVSHWLSFILGILSAAVKLRYLIAGFDPGGMGFRINELWGFLGAVLIVWYAWRVPKQDA
jgi:hypothetical protein